MIPFGAAITHSPKETFEIAYAIGQSLDQPRIFLLEGELGAGKTIFAKGLICGLGQHDPNDVPSPSFTLINEYLLRFKVYHIDLYRLESEDDLHSLDLEDVFAEPAVIIVEWAERLGGRVLEDSIRVKLENLQDDQRRIDIQAARTMRTR